MRVYNIAIVITYAFALVTPDLPTPSQVYRIDPWANDHFQIMVEVDEVAEIQIDSKFYSSGEYWALETHEDHEWYDARRLKDANVHGYGFDPTTGELVNLDSLPISRRRLLELNVEACRKHETLTNEWELDATHYDVCQELSHPNPEFGLSNDHDKVRTAFIDAETVDNSDLY